MDTAAYPGLILFFYKLQQQQRQGQRLQQRRGHDARVPGAEHGQHDPGAEPDTDGGRGRRDRVLPAVGAARVQLYGAVGGGRGSDTGGSREREVAVWVWD